MSNVQPSLAREAAPANAPQAFRVQSTDGRCTLFDSARIDANYVTRQRADGSIDVAIVVTDASGELKEFIVRHYSHNEVHHMEPDTPAA